MRIQIDGTGTVNKGAELMLYSILEEIQRVHPESTVYLNSYSASPFHIQSKLQVKKRPLLRITEYPRILLNKFGIPHRVFTTFYPCKHVHLVLDASGYKFGDHWKYSERYIKYQSQYLTDLKRNKAKIIFLPQAFGPFSHHDSSRLIEILFNNADKVYARDELSARYLMEKGGIKSKMGTWPDFTIKCKGIIPEDLNHLEGKVCIIPNHKMFTQTKSSISEYIDLMRLLLAEVKKKGKEVFLLNHEGDEDLKLCRLIKHKTNPSIPIISGLNAKETKGVIGLSYLVISSRYHGIASALNQSVPCLATSWSHKYEMLFKDYNVNDGIVDITADKKDINNQISDWLGPENNSELRNKLSQRCKAIESQVDDMWVTIWNTLETVER
ncbi:MAG: polysaccharide pyruvyl transferase family protein [Balneolales bacterium]